MRDQMTGLYNHASFGLHLDELIDAFNKADKTLYLAKREGKNRILTAKPKAE